jgi:glycosyltransferase involved in cell wall biosynthesis
MKPSLLCLLPRPPHPTRDGGAIRAWNLLRGLTDAYRVHAFVLRAPRSAEGEYPPGIEVREIPHGGRLLRRAAAAGRSLTGAAAYSELLFRSARLQREVPRAVDREKPAWVVALSYHLGPLTTAQAVPSWIDFQNVDSEIWERIGQTAASPLARSFARGQAPRVAALERRLASGAGGISCVSARDAKTLAAMAPGAEPLVVPNGVDLERYRFREHAQTDPIVFFVGDLSWPPNAEGLRWFRTRVWPLVRQRRPEARVEILGRGAPADLVAGGGADFRFLGEGGDTRPHWHRAAVSIVPLRAGGGTRLKILEAAACGVPVVSTPVGAEGLELQPGVEIAIAEDPASFAQEVSRLLADPESRRRQAAAARRRVEAVSDWGPIGAAFARELRRRSPSA